MHKVIGAVLSILVFAAALPAAALAKSVEPVARQDEADFVEANVLGIFYHELGHAAIFAEGVPIFGQEEDAADVFSILMIDALYDEETAQSLAADASFGFAGEAEARDKEDDDVAWWDVHGPDEQRYYNTVCLFYGGDPDNRQDFAEALELPEERADGCAEEYAQASESWGAVLDDMTEISGRAVMTFSATRDSAAARILRAEVDQLNSELRLSIPIAVSVEPCGEANAFFDPETSKIVFCSEFEDHLHEVYQLLE